MALLIVKNATECLVTLTQINYGDKNFLNFNIKLW